MIRCHLPGDIFQIWTQRTCSGEFEFFHRLAFLWIFYLKVTTNRELGLPCRSSASYSRSQLVIRPNCIRKLFFALFLLHISDSRAHTHRLKSRHSMLCWFGPTNWRFRISFLFHVCVCVILRPPKCHMPIWPFPSSFSSFQSDVLWFCIPPPQCVFWLLKLVNGLYLWTNFKRPQSFFESKKRKASGKPIDFLAASVLYRLLQFSTLFYENHPHWNWNENKMQCEWSRRLFIRIQ